MPDPAPACPVCRRQIDVYGHRIMRVHRDTAGNCCPMSARRLPVENFEWEVA